MCSLNMGTMNFALYPAAERISEWKHDWEQPFLENSDELIFRNTPQWFVFMDKMIDPKVHELRGELQEVANQFGPESAEFKAKFEAIVEYEEANPSTLRGRALKAIDDTRFVPAAGQRRLRSMIESRPDWVLSRQRAWGVPICVFADEDGKVLVDEEVNARIIEAFEAEGADAWFAEGARERFLGSRAGEPWKQVTDILDVWFDSGSTHSFVLEDRPDLKWPADVYLEGSDQHRGWFHSSLLTGCAIDGHAPYKELLTHGFTVDEQGAFTLVSEQDLPGCTSAWESCTTG